MKDQGWCVNPRKVSKANFVVAGRFGGLGTAEKLMPVLSNKKRREFGTGTAHDILVHQPARGSLLLKCNSASVPIALDLQAAKLGSPLLATGHPKLSIEALHELVADLKRLNREKAACVYARLSRQESPYQIAASDGLVQYRLVSGGSFRATESGNGEKVASRRRPGRGREADRGGRATRSRS